MTNKWLIIEFVLFPPDTVASWRSGRSGWTRGLPIQTWKVKWQVCTFVETFNLSYNQPTILPIGLESKKEVWIFQGILFLQSESTYSQSTFPFTKRASQASWSISQWPTQTKCGCPTHSSRYLHFWCRNRNIASILSDVTFLRPTVNFGG